MSKLENWFEKLKKNFIKSSSTTESKTAKSKDDNKNENSNKKNKNLFTKGIKTPNFFVSVLVNSIKFLLLTILIFGFIGIGAVVGVAKAYLDSTPELDIMQIEDQSETSFIYDKNGKLITEYYGYENRVWASIDEIPQNLKDAFVAIEDARFWVHKGIDIKRIFGSIIHNLSNESVQGASTITQQLIKNTILTPEVNYKRKIQEIYLATELEKNYEKDEILEAYLNTIWLGGSNYGVKAAAKDYFGKDLSELTIRECAMLAGITRNPWQYDPRANTYTRDNVKVSYDRTNFVIDRMYEYNLISKEEYEQYKIKDNEYYLKSVRIIEDPSSNDYPMKYFLEYVIEDVRDRIMTLNDWEGEEGKRKAERYLYSGGLKIYTTLDPKIQQSVEEAVYEYNNLPQFANPIHNISKQGLEQPQAAAVVIDQHTGELQAIVGGKQPPTGKRQFNRAFNPDAKLPMGSSIKPLSVYGPFIEAGYPGGIIIENIPAAIDGWKGGEYPYPRNYGGGSYTGPTDVRYGIYKSLNVIAARIILDRISPQYSADKLKELGFNSKYINEEPASLSLGTDGNIMIEAAGAYAALSNKGEYLEPISFTRVVDKNGKTIINMHKEQISRTVFKESTTFILTEWMKDVVNGGTVTVKVQNSEGENINVAGKTGTNNDFRGVYFAGFTPYYTTTVWLGHDDFHAFVKDTTGGKFAAPLWKNIMDRLHENLSNKEFFDEIPDDVVEFTVCPVSGKRPNGELCTKSLGGDHKLVTEWFPKNAVPGPEDICDMHVQITVCPYSGKPLSPYCPTENSIKGSAIVLPKNSPYRELSDQDLEKYLPGAVRDLDRLAGLDYDNPNDREFFCPLHTKEWAEGEEKRDEMETKASLILAHVHSNMSNNDYLPKLTPNRLDILNMAITQLEEALESGKIALPDASLDDEEELTTLPLFDYNLVQEAMDNLTNISDDIFTTIERELEEDRKNAETNDNNDGDENSNGNNDED